MRSLLWFLISMALVAAAFVAPAPASAQTSVKPYFLVIFDNSGSMDASTGSGNNSCGMPHTRMNDAKCVFQDVINGFGDVTFGLMRFEVDHRDGTTCDTDPNPLTSECTAVSDNDCDCQSYDFYLSCSSCNESSGASCPAIGNDARMGELVVPIQDGNQSQILEFVDYSCDFCDIGEATNPELVANTWTPLAGSLRGARRYFEGGDPTYASPIAADPYAGCRPYFVILLTDGRETCSRYVDTNAAATELRTTTYMGTPYDIQTHVVAFGFGSPPDATTDNIAAAGGTTSAHYAQNEEQLALAFSQIVSDSLLFEVCNNVDDNCNGLIDEGFTKYCAVPGGPLTECVDPGETVCDTVDDNCDGRVDEGLLNLCGVCGPEPTEVCNGVDDDCDGIIDDGVCGGCTPTPEICDGLDNDCDGTADEGITRPCGTNVGACTIGTQSCVAGAFGMCTGQGPVAESCDGVDNDCDGVTDGMSRACGSSTGTCVPGTEICTAGAYGTCTGQVGPSAELCDTLDNDCDGTDDEGNPGGGGACGSSTGACSPGSLTCSALGTLTCTGGTLPSSETCNGIDDDCNGLVDDGVPTGGSCGSSTGECSLGVLTCSGGAFSCVGDVGPSAEVCDGRDNDCDGTDDEGNPGGGASCGSGTGACSPGSLTCTAGTLTCTGGVLPAPETCNSTDDDCNGLVDDGVPTGGSCGSGTGECSLGVLTCSGGAFSCVGDVGPSAEVCDGRDNDCDGTDDEGNPGGGASCGSSIGACSSGSLTCTGGGLTCTGGVLPAAETCNSIDDNCNGVVDDGVPTAGSCGSSTGECDLGVLTCSGGAFSCIGDIGPSVEVCDGRDNDCDGANDEGNPGGGLACGSSTGICSPGASACVSGALTCSGGTLPGVEICNGLDDDCDGLIDEGNPGGGVACGASDVGVCEFGALACTMGTLVCVGETGPTMETCNGLDDDCDGPIDEGNPEGGAACGDDTGECMAGTTLCASGMLTCDGGTGPTVEICDGLDNDCDGVEDEGLGVGAPCGTDIGECSPGVNICMAGGLVCTGEIGPTEEICNLLDDDCDGMVDELALGGACGTDEGICVAGNEQCITGAIICVGAVDPGSEVCDCSDNDCNGMTDEGEGICPTGTACRDCGCADPCAMSEFGFTCPTGTTPETETAMDGSTACYCVAPRCESATCATETVERDGETLCTPDSSGVSNCVCKNNACSFPCEGVVCEAGLACDPRDPAGRCVPDNCTGLGCPDGEICNRTTAECEANACADVTCGATEACRDGSCEGSCATVTCPGGETCSAGTCSADLCDGVACLMIEFCDATTGDCLTDMCRGVNCPAGTVCGPESGDCEDDPCERLTCPEGERCIAGVGECEIIPVIPDAGVDSGAADAGVDSGAVDSGEELHRVLASGGGGCVCSVPGADTHGDDHRRTGALALTFGLFGLGFWRRRRRGRGALSGTKPFAGKGLGKAVVVAAAAVVALFIGGCDVDPYCLNCVEEDAGAVDTGVRVDSGARDTGIVGDTGALDAGPADMGPDGCVPGAPEVCNGFDDDCDGMIDEGVDTDTDTDNCGACGNRCAPLNAFPECVAGACELGTCRTGFYDIDMDDTTGCEYRCTTLDVAADDSVCDLRDNDCDGDVDEDVAFDTDPLNCGTCGTVCRFAHGTGDCSAGACVLGACDTDFYDIDGSQANGCEYSCSPASPATETCNGRDDDCDGMIDEGDPDGGGACGMSTGVCSVGVEVCTAGALVCTGSTEPTTELCNGLDDDCDGVVDQGDPEAGRLCGSSLGACIQGREVCTAGALVCTGGVTSAPEVCNGLDDDCDGSIDEGNPDGGSACGSGTGACTTGLEACRGGVLVCEGAVGGSTEICNGIDDDCDGAADEGDPGGGAFCGSGVGACVQGRQVCTGGALLCTGAITGSPEVCNGLDDDCDGSIDEGNPDGGSSCGNGTGACMTGLEACRGGVLVCEGAVGGTPETCNGIDDDCDGVVDQGDPEGGAFCGSGVGACVQGRQACTGGTLVCTGAVTGSTETCNGIDDDCDGSVDDGNPDGGASCGTGTGACMPGLMTCQSGGLVCDGAVGGTPETCNGIDDDCNGMVDEGNPEGGASCGSAIGQCAAGTQTCMAGSLSCVGATGPSAETCNSLDDDCDGTIDDGNPGGGGACGVTTGECTAGTEMCSAGALQCVGGTGPSLELCDTLDNNCDGSTDEGFDLVNDVRNCGGCGTLCTLDHAFVGCSSGSCVISGCHAGWVDLDGLDSTGCEYACDGAAGATEACNGVDDDCDGTTDIGAAVPANYCNANGVCAGTSPTCAGASGWECNYPASYEPTETTCDGFDNDCDGLSDEPFPLVGTSCNNSEVGACLRTGGYVCNGTQDGVVCNAPASGGGLSEVCNGEDDDCDGVLDEGSPDAWTRITGAFGTRWIMTYEASRPDATDLVQGSMDHRVCSDAARLPWASVTYPEAVAACATIGARLCTEEEWQRACEVTTPCLWSNDPSCTTYEPNACNGDEFDFDSGTPGDQDGLLPSGNRTQCFADWDPELTPFDLSGNVEEWAEARSLGVNPIRGGSYNDTRGGLMCGFDFVVANDSLRLPTVGFRCCRSTAPP